VDYTFKREEFAPVYTLEGIQDPLAIFSGPVSCSAKVGIVMTDGNIYSGYTNPSAADYQTTFDVKAVQGTGTGQNGIEIHNNVANLEDVKFDVSKAFVRLDGGFTAITNATDATTAGGGISPVKVTLSAGTQTSVI
jgi:hypothetical protein